MGGRFENFTPPTLGSELTASEITMLEEITALSNSSSGQFIRKESGSLVNSTLSETIALANLSDVAISGPASGHVLSYNGSSWVNATLSETITLANLSDVAILAPAHNQILSYDVATSSWKNKDITNLATTSINGDFTSAQLIVTASTGTDFTITTAGGTTTVAIPSASATARGLITTGAQAITGIKNFINNTDSASVQVGIFEGDRATIADGDEGYLTFRLSDSAGNQDEGARITWKATTVLTGATQDTDLIFSALVNNSLTTMLTLDGSAGQLVPVAINAAGVTSPDLGTVTTIDLNGGTIDGTTIGATTASTIVGTTIAGSTAGNVLTIQNTTDAASNQVGIFRGGNRATPAANDEGYFTFTLDDSLGAQQEFGRLSWLASDVTSTSKDGAFTFDAPMADVFTQLLRIDLTGLTIGGQATGRLTFGIGNGRISASNTLGFENAGTISFEGVGGANLTAQERSFVTRMTDGAGVCLMSIRSFNALSTAGARIMNWYSDNGTTEVASLNKDGLLQLDGGLNLDSTFDIDSGTGANALDSTATTSDAFTFTASSLTTGDGLRIVSNSADTNARNLVEILQDNAAATATTALSIQQDGDERALYVTQNGNDTCYEATTAATTFYAIDIGGNSLTTGGLAYLYSNSADTNVRTLTTIINDNTLATGAIGLSIQQDSTGAALAIRDSAVAHGMTDVAATDIYGVFKYGRDGLGGLLVEGLDESSTSGGLVLSGTIGGAADTTKTTAGLGIIDVFCAIKSGTGRGVAAAGGNLFSVRNFTTTNFIVGSDALHSNFALTEYDEYDDLALTRAFSIASGKAGAKGFIDREYDKFVKYNEQTLIDAGLLGAPLKEGGLTNITGMIKLHTGALGQVREMFYKLREKIEEQALRITQLEQQRLLPT